ncbi:MAG: hypothetical protein AB9844_11985 [Clostridiaceae bacterium]
MDKEKVLEYLEENDLNDVELIKEENGYFAVKFYYDFDIDEMKAAEAYANDEAGKEKNETWQEDFYLPYLTELAVDNVGEIIEDIMSETGIKSQFVSYEMEYGDDFSEFIAIFYEEESPINIEDVLDKLEV